MGTGCSRKTRGFQKLYHENSEENSMKILEKIKILTSNTYYSHLKSGVKLKDFIRKNQLCVSIEIIEEMSLYVMKNWVFPLKNNRKVRRSAEKQLYSRYCG